MQNPRLASRYAKSLLDLAIEQNSVESTLKDMQLLDSICSHSRDFDGMLRSPIIKADKKQHVISAILSGRIHTVTQAFITLLVNKGREANLPEIAHSFISQYKEMKNIKTVTLTTAIPVNDNVKKSILSKVAANLVNDSIDLKTEVDPDLLGGFVLEMEDKLFDASVRRDLKDIKAQFLDNSYVSNLR
ncbi:MAG TPA: ATP synthase F1 subunit delta [Flavipsychrobacter sp.]|nr:ATP synthase F1 subunit delta [Flavipsychrobacter sp.]